MTAAARETRHHPDADVLLNLLWPGLGQFNQGRAAAGVFFALEALALLVMMAAYPGTKTAAATLIAAIGVWSIVDVLNASRRRPSGD